MSIQIITDISTVQTNITNALSGSTIIIPNGTYLVNTIIKIAGTGLTIKAQTVGGVIFTGGNISFNITGNNNILDGIQFINTSSNMSSCGGGNFNSFDLITINGSNNTISNININNVYALHFINIYSGTQYNTITKCNIQNKPMDNTKCLNSMIEIQGHSTIVGFHNINNCSFQNMINGSGGDYGCEPIRLGDSAYSTFNLSAIVEYCVFDNTHLADNETISIKSMYNVIRYNTFSNNPNAYISFRNGNNNYAYGNFFINSSGIRIKQATNIYIYNNYFSGWYPPIIFVDMTGLYPDLTIYQNNINILNNTFYKCNPISFGNRDTKNNIMLNNILYNTSIVGDTSGFTSFENINNPTMMINSKGYYTITSSNSGIAASVDKNPDIDVDSNILLDITGLTRLSPFDIGCNNVSNILNEKPINYPRTLVMVCPSYLN